MPQTDGGWTKSEGNPVLFYKFQGQECSQEFDLAKDDFAMVIQNPFQKQMAQKFAHKGMCRFDQGRREAEQAPGQYFDPGPFGIFSSVYCVFLKRNRPNANHRGIKKHF